MQTIFILAISKLTDIIIDLSSVQVVLISHLSNPKSTFFLSYSCSILWESFFISLIVYCFSKGLERVLSLCTELTSFCKLFSLILKLYLILSISSEKTSLTYRMYLENLMIRLKLTGCQTIYSELILISFSIKLF